MFSSFRLPYGQANIRIRPTALLPLQVNHRRVRGGEYIKLCLSGRFSQGSLAFILSEPRDCTPYLKWPDATKIYELVTQCMHLSRHGATSASFTKSPRLGTKSTPKWRSTTTTKCWNGVGIKDLRVSSRNITNYFEYCRHYCVSRDSCFPRQRAPRRCKKWATILCIFGHRCRSLSGRVYCGESVTHINTAQDFIVIVCYMFYWKAINGKHTATQAFWDHRP